MKLERRIWTPFRARKIRDLLLSVFVPLVPPKNRSGEFPEIVNRNSNLTLQGEPEKQKMGFVLKKPEPPLPDSQHHHSTNKGLCSCHRLSFGFFTINN
jgi:hypothetical protein